MAPRLGQWRRPDSEVTCLCSPSATSAGRCLFLSGLGVPSLTRRARGQRLQYCVARDLWPSTGPPQSPVEHNTLWSIGEASDGGVVLAEQVVGVPKGQVQPLYICRLRSELGADRPRPRRAAPGCRAGSARTCHAPFCSSAP
eukprot:1028542-Rhodomonas_salina.2